MFGTLSKCVACLDLCNEIPAETLHWEEAIEVLDEQQDEPVVFSRRPHPEWANYDPDNDDYDIRTAPLQPPQLGAEDIILKQIEALRSRVRKGGDPDVLQHYRAVILELQNRLLCDKLHEHFVDELSDCSTGLEDESQSQMGSEAGKVVTSCSWSESPIPDEDSIINVIANPSVCMLAKSKASFDSQMEPTFLSGGDFAQNLELRQSLRWL